jgi:hypothetical protein
LVIATASSSRGLTRTVAPIFSREREFPLVEIDRDDPAGAGEARALHRRQPDRAAADHHDHVAIGDLRDVERGAHPGHHAAAEETSAVERQFLGHDDRLVIGRSRSNGRNAGSTTARRGRRP